MDVARTRETTALPEPSADTQPFVEDSRDGKSDESQPCESGQPEQAY
jgi:hypothetical protein